MSFILSVTLTDEQIYNLAQNSDAARTILFLFEMFKLLRLGRIKKLIAQSQITSRLSDEDFFRHNR